MPPVGRSCLSAPARADGAPHSHRLTVERMPPPDHSDQAGFATLGLHKNVITSYSIHYTKLYDKSAVFQDNEEFFRLDGKYIWRWLKPE